jgi:hypothetical protein
MNLKFTKHNIINGVKDGGFRLHRLHNLKNDNSNNNNTVVDGAYNIWRKDNDSNNDSNNDSDNDIQKKEKIKYNILMCYDDFLSKDAFEALSNFFYTRNYLQKSDFQSNSEYIIDKNVRESYTDECMIEDIPYYKLISKEILNYINKENKEYSLCKYFRCIKYINGGFFKKHTDSLENGEYTGILCIQPPTKGGELKLYTNDEKVIGMKKNRFIFFSKTIEHECLRVEGEKHIITFSFNRK